MARVALPTMSDGRDFVACDLTGFCQGAEGAAAAALATQPDLTVFRYPVWAFPHFTMLASGGALDQIGRTHVRASDRRQVSQEGSHSP